MPLFNVTRKLITITLQTEGSREIAENNKSVTKQTFICLDFVYRD